MGGISLLGICLRILFMSGLPSVTGPTAPTDDVQEPECDSSKQAAIATVSLCNAEWETLENTGPTILQYTWSLGKDNSSELNWFWSQSCVLMLAVMTANITQKPDLYPCSTYRKRYQLQTMDHWFRQRWTHIRYWTKHSWLAHGNFYLCWVGFLHREISYRNSKTVNGIKVSCLFIKHQKEHSSGWQQQ